MAARPRTISDETILKTARQIFLEQGPHISTTEIASQLGISQATLFKRFGTKETLILKAVATPMFGEYIALIESGPKQGNMKIQLKTIAKKLASIMQDVFALHAVLHAAGLHFHQIHQYNNSEPPPLRGKKMLTAWFVQAIEKKLIQPVNAETIATMFVGSIQAHIFFQSMQKDKKPTIHDEFLHSFIDNLWLLLNPDQVVQ